MAVCSGGRRHPRALCLLEMVNNKYLLNENIKRLFKNYYFKRNKDKAFDFTHVRSFLGIY